MVAKTPRSQLTLKKRMQTRLERFESAPPTLATKLFPLTHNQSDSY